MTFVPNSGRVCLTACLLGQLGADVDHLEQGHEEGRVDAALDCKDGCLSDQVSGGAPHVRHWGGVGGPGADPGADCLVGQLAELSRDPSNLHTALMLAASWVLGERVLVWAGAPWDRLIWGPGAAVVGVSGA